MMESLRQHPAVVFAQFTQLPSLKQQGIVHSKPTDGIGMRFHSKLDRLPL
jgi:hypothetical protein